MCGIAGYIGPSPPADDRVRYAADVLAHRGPDGQGVFGADGVRLIHRRLAILDLDSRSDQPFRLKGHVLVFNGEIYNYVEVRRDLEHLGHAFVTTGDTEVLARALLEWGEDALDRLEGMWAFAWYNEASGELMLSRDRFGEKPLYLWKRDGGLYFASEVKGLAALAGEWPAANRDHICRFLVNGYKSLFKTSAEFYLGVSEVPAGTSVIATAEKVGPPRRYWSRRVEVDQSLSYEDAVAATRDALVRSVKLRLRSDVPLAFCMSGGVDSNALIATASKRLGYDVHGFTIVNTDARYDEQDMVDLSVRDLGIRHTEVPLRQEGFLDDLAGLVAAHDMPIATVTWFVHAKLMAAIAADGYKVTVSGTAADELFTGYFDHQNLYLHAVAGTPAHSPARAAWMAHQSGIVRNPYLRNPDLYLENEAERRHVFLGNERFASWLVSPWAEAFRETDFGRPLLRNRMMNELFEEIVPVMLREDDANAMLHSLENRSPFLDRELYELAYSIPPEHLVQDARAKSVLRDAMRGVVADPILDNRRKVGFNAPILDLLDVGSAQVREALLDDSPVFEIVRREAIEELLAQETMPNSDSKYLFSFLGVKLFLEGRG